MDRAAKVGDSTLENGYRMIPNFLTREERGFFKAVLERERARFTHIPGKMGMTLPYQVIDGVAIRAYLPEIVEFAQGRLRELIESLVGKRLRFMDDETRSLRLQYYKNPSEGFLWHLDGGLYSALLTFCNENGGGTEVLSPIASRLLKPAPYLLFPFQKVLELARPRLLVSQAGDVLVIQGGSIIHRGVNPAPGERMVLVATFDPVDTKPTPVWDWIARRLNY